jgi:hypothetical protein
MSQLRVPMTNLTEDYSRQAKLFIILTGEMTHSFRLSGQEARSGISTWKQPDITCFTVLPDNARRR